MQNQLFQLDHFKGKKTFFSLLISHYYIQRIIGPYITSSEDSMMGHYMTE